MKTGEFGELVPANVVGAWRTPTAMADDNDTTEGAERAAGGRASSRGPSEQPGADSRPVTIVPVMTAGDGPSRPDRSAAR